MSAPLPVESPGSTRQVRGSALRTVLRMCAVFLVTSLALFCAIHAMPEDPVSLRMKKPDPERVAEIRAELGLDDPLAVQYLRYLGDFFSGDWGVSLVSGRPVAEDIRHAFPATLELGMLAMGVGICAGITLALAAHWTGWRGIRHVTSGVGALGLTVPIFWIGLLLIILFSVRLGWFPVGGRFDFTQPAPRGTGFYLLDTMLAGDANGFISALKHLALPVLTLALYPTALVAGTLHASLEDERIHVLVRSLRAKGVAPRAIWFKHILRMVSAPVATIVGTNFGALLGGAVLTETVFSWPGMGRYIVDGVQNRDFFVISNALLLVIVLAFVVITLADLLAVALNPAVRRAGGSA